MVFWFYKLPLTVTRPLKGFDMKLISKMSIEKVAWGAAGVIVGLWVWNRIPNQYK